MNDTPDTKRASRLAGLAYLAMIVFSAGGYMRMTRLLAGDLPMVMTRLRSSQAVFNLAFAAMTIGFVAWVVLAFMLYRLMRSFGRIAGALMQLFTVAGAAMNLIGLSRLLPFLSSSGLGMTVGTLGPALQSYEYLLVLAQIFSGLWMFPFGWLVLRSRIAPRVLGYCLIVGGIGYLLIPVTTFVPTLDQVLAYRIVSRAPGIPAMVGEIGMCLWLLIKGARRPGVDRAVAP